MEGTADPALVDTGLPGLCNWVPRSCSSEPGSHVCHRNHFQALQIGGLWQQTAFLRHQGDDFVSITSHLLDLAMLWKQVIVAILRSGVFFSIINSSFVPFLCGFCILQGSFSVALKGIAPTGNVQCQADLDFGSCSVKETAEKLFQFSNIGDKPTLYEWIVEPPFSIMPKEGLLQSGERLSAICCFMPDKACTYSAQVLLKIFYPVNK